MTTSARVTPDGTVQLQKADVLEKRNVMNVPSSADV
jgi:hypothetical protein